MLQQTFNEQVFREQAERDGITHISTGVAVVKDNKILLARRAQHDFLGGQYELPGGGVDPGETITDAAIREVAEETGLTVTRVIGTFDGFDYTTDKKPRVRQINFLVEADGTVTLDPNEHDEYAWIGETEIDTLGATDTMKQCVHDAFRCLGEN